MYFAGFHEGCVYSAGVANVGEQLLHGQEALRVAALPFQRSRNLLEKIFDIAEEQIIFVAVVQVKSGTGNSGAVQYVLDGDFVEGFLLHERDQGIAEQVTGMQSATIGFMRLRTFAGLHHACSRTFLSSLFGIAATLEKTHCQKRAIYVYSVCMTDDRKAGIALIAGSLGGILTMHIHPTGGGTMTAEQAARLSWTSAAAHSLALISVLFLFLGACGLARRLAGADRISFAAIVIYGFSCVAIMIAAAVSGFIVPSLVIDMLRDVPEHAREWPIVIKSIFQINQGFARIFSVGASLAILLWSLSVLRNKRLSTWVAIYGCVVAPVIIIAIAIGHWRLDVRGMAVVVFGQAIWFIAAGSQLCSQNLDM